VNPAVGWALASGAIFAGWFGYGWRGLVLALTVIVFWLLLQFSRTLRVLRAAGRRPVGHVDSAVMLHAQLRRGMRLIELLSLTRSLGRKVGDQPEAFAWRDDGQVELQAEFVDGRLQSWRLRRPDEPATS
jgi:hypothetical protein